MPETWKPIPGWPYEASSSGRIRGVERQLADGRTSGCWILRPAEDDDGYLRVTLSDGGRRQAFGVHVLVALAWKGQPRGRRKEVRHLNGRKADCRPGNLVWSTRGTNERDKARHRRKLMSPLVTRRLGR